MVKRSLAGLCLAAIGAVSLVPSGEAAAASLCYAAAPFSGNVGPGAVVQYGWSNPGTVVGSYFWSSNSNLYNYLTQRPGYWAAPIQYVTYKNESPYSVPVFPNGLHILILAC